MRVAVIDDWQQAARQCADWSMLDSRADVQFFSRPFTDVEQMATQLAPFEIIVPMRERSALQRALLERLPKLRLLALTGMGTRHVDVDYCRTHGIVLCGSGQYSPATTAEFTLGLILAAARHIAQGAANMRSGLFQEGIAPGFALEGRTLGIAGVGRIGTRVASYGRALGMKLIGWSQNLTDEQAQAAGVVRVSKQDLLSESDVLSLHLVYSPRSHHVFGAAELALMKSGALLVNTSRGPLIDEHALLDCLRGGQLMAALDVYDQEPLPVAHPLRQLPNALLTPHLGFGAQHVLNSFYQQSVENILAFMDGQSLRVLNPKT